MAAVVHRVPFQTSRLLDFCSRDDLIAQTGHQPAAWPLVVLKELVDNALDACEDCGTAPDVAVVVNQDGITVRDNGSGIKPETVRGVLDFSVRVSSRAAYVAPDRGKQGNALKTLMAMPYALDPEAGVVEVTAAGVRHLVSMRVDRLRQKPEIHHIEEVIPTKGTSVTVRWPNSACSLLHDAKARFLQIAADYPILNPHLSLTVNWYGDAHHYQASNPSWRKWRPSNPTNPHWYTPADFERLVAAYIAHDRDRGRDRPLREFVAEFDGLTGSRKPAVVLNAAGLTRKHLSALATEDGVDAAKAASLLSAMQAQSRPVKPEQLGVIGKDHLQTALLSLGCQPESFRYRKKFGRTLGLPWVQEVAFGHAPTAKSRRFVAGVNWSPGIVNPIRELGRFGRSLDSVLEDCRVGPDEPVVLVLHIACPRIESTDRGKSAVVIKGDLSEDFDIEIYGEN